MTFVVTEACIRCKYTDCVDVCPKGLKPAAAISKIKELMVRRAI